MVRQRIVQHEHPGTALESADDGGFDVRLAEDMWDTVLRWFDILK